MSKDMEKMLVPKLRFPEFRGAGEWSVKELGEVAKLITEKAGNNRYTLMSVTAGVGLVTQIEKFGKEIAGAAYKNYYVIRKGDFAYNKSSTKEHPEGQMALLESVDNGAVPNSIFTCFRVDSESALPVFLKYPFATNIHGKWLRKFIAIGARANGALNVDSKYLLTLPVALPLLSEQQKIADCLSSVDELINAQNQKVEALKTHKKGLIQQLLPREGETIPRLRFPEFRDSGEWQEVALGEIAEIKLGKMLDKQKHTTGRLLPYLNNMSVRWNEINTSNLPQMYFDDVELDRFGLKAGDVVVCEGGEPGRAAVWDGRLPDLKFQKAIHRVRFNVPFDPRLLVLHLENLAGTTQFEMLFTGGGIKHLTRETFAQLKIPLIPHAEQQKIADCLSSIDALISAHRQKLDNLKIHKKGLIQVLFPAVEMGV